MTEGNGTERVIGQLQAEVKNLRDIVGELTEKVDVLNGHMERQKGGWKVITMVAGAAGVAGGFITKWIPHT